MLPHTQARFDPSVSHFFWAVWGKGEILSLCFSGTGLYICIRACFYGCACKKGGNCHRKGKGGIARNTTQHTCVYNHPHAHRITAECTGQSGQEGTVKGGKDL